MQTQKKKPTLDEIRGYLHSRNPLGLKDAEVTLVNEHNHLIYRLDKNKLVYALRMINPESYRAKEWISMEEEYRLLNALMYRKSTNRGPEVYAFDGGFSLPLVIQEFVEADCFNNLQLLSRDHLIGASQAIAELNTSGITPDVLAFLTKYTENQHGFQKTVLFWKARLLDSFRRCPRLDIWLWIRRISSLISEVRKYLRQYEKFFATAPSCFHFDGAHTGNTYWRNGKVMFLDWQKVSYRNDPTFTLVRFMTSAGTQKGVVLDEIFNILVEEYIRINPQQNFREMARARLVERLTSDLVWVFWDYTRIKSAEPFSSGGLEIRYREIERLISR